MGRIDDGLALFHVGRRGGFGGDENGDVVDEGKEILGESEVVPLRAPGGRPLHDVPFAKPLVEDKKGRR